MRWPMPWPMRWSMLWLAPGTVGVLLILFLTPVWAGEETPAPNRELREQYAHQAFDQVTVRFNTNITAYSSWEAFKAAVLPRLSQDTLGRCYTLPGSGMQPVEVTQVHFQGVRDGPWQPTSGKGWRQYQKDHTFIEYRVNEKAKVLLQAEGIKPWFFFAQIRKICEFPL